MLDNIEQLEESVREHINTSRNQNVLIKDSDNWNQICSSLDTVGDTIYSLQDYLAADYPEKIGLRYIFTYGLLQALFIQQDAIGHLAEAFNLPFELTDRLKEIRTLRNAAIGHPTKNKVKGTTYYNYISRMSLSKSGFTLLRSFNQGQDEFIDIELYPIISDQLKDIMQSYLFIESKLVEADKMHKEKYKEKLLADIFPSSMSYSFSKIAQGIRSLDESNLIFAKSMLNSIKTTYESFEKALLDRNELDDSTKYDLIEYNHALDRINEYLNGSCQNMDMSDAQIYHYYICERHNHFVKIAKEVDSEYQ